MIFCWHRGKPFPWWAESDYILRATQLLHGLISTFFFFFFLLLLVLLLRLSRFHFCFSLTPPYSFRQVPWLLMVPQHASPPLLWGHSVLLHTVGSVNGFCSTKGCHQLLLCITRHKQVRYKDPASRGRKRLLLLDYKDGEHATPR